MRIIPFISPCPFPPLPQPPLPHLPLPQPPPQISHIYKDLTRSPVHPLGGQAYLHVDNEEEPFAGGVKYTAIPPAKRFRDMEQLSGEGVQGRGVRTVYRGGARSVRRRPFHWDIRCCLESTAGLLR